MSTASGRTPNGDRKASLHRHRQIRMSHVDMPIALARERFNLLAVSLRQRSVMARPRPVPMNRRNTVTGAAVPEWNVQLSLNVALTQ